MNPGTMLPTGEGVWVHRGGALSLVDVDATRVVRSFEVSDEVQGFEARDSDLWVTDYPGSDVRRLDAGSGEVVEEVDAADAAWGIALAGGRLWTANRTEGSLSAISPDGDTATVDLPDGAAPMSLFLLAGRLWATDVEQGLVYEVDPYAGVLVDVHEVASPVIQMSESADAVWATCGDAAALVRFGF